MHRNLKQAQASRGRISNILAKEGVPSPVVCMFYHEVVVVVLLYVKESLVLPLSVLRTLEGFHLEYACRITGMHPKRRSGK